MFRKVWFTTVAGALVLAVSCGGGASAPPTTQLPPITISLSASSTTAPVNGISPFLTVTLQRAAGDSNPVTLTVVPLPSNVTPQITSPGTGSSGTISFSAAGTATPGTYAVTVNATEGGSTATSPLSLTVLSAPATVNITVSPTVNTSVGFGGQLQTFMTTTFMAAEWDRSFFPALPSATATLGTLNPQHIRVLTNNEGIPQQPDQSWDFSVLDATVDPVLSVGDHSIVLVLAAAPFWMDNQNTQLPPSNFQYFAKYAQQMVQYYNTTAGFTDSNGVQHVHTPFTPITYWGIFNEPDANGLSAADYANLYNLTVTAMQAAGSLVPLKFVAVELGGTFPNDYVPGFISGVTAQVDVVTGHNFAVCGWNNLDVDALNAIPLFFVPYAQQFASLLANSSKLSQAQLWLSDNNVDSDFAIGNGAGACTDPFELDPRGTSAFFAGWRPYVFSQWAQAGSHMLSHWNFNQDPTLTTMTAEVTYTTGQPYISYWVDYYLQRYFPYCAPDEPSTCTAGGASILSVTSSEPAGLQTVEPLAVRNADGSVVVMAVDHAVNGPNDVNGPGAPRNVVLDLSQLGVFTSANVLTIDANTDLTSGPTPVSVGPAAQMTLSLGGYGVSFLKLIP